MNLRMWQWFRKLDEAERKAETKHPGESGHNISVAILIGARHISEGLSDIAEAIRAIAVAIRAIGPQPTKLVLLYTLRTEHEAPGKGRSGGQSDGRSEFMGASIANAQVGQVYDPKVTESNPTVPSIPPVGALVYATDNAAVATVDPATGVATMVSPGTANISVMDQGDNLTDTVNFTVAAVPPPPPVADKLDLEYTLASPVQAKAEPSRPFGK